MTVSKVGEIRSRLGPPAWEGPDLLLYQGDATDLLSRMDSAMIDLTVTSPPYNIGKEYEEPMPLESYLEWCAAWCEQIHRVTSPDGAFWLNLGYIGVPGLAKAIPIPYLLWPHISFYLVQEVVWNYGAGVAARKMFSPRNEKWLWYVKNPDSYAFNLDSVRDRNVKYPNQKKNGRLRVNPLGKNPTDVWAIPKVTTGEGLTGRRASPERTAHPSQFPLAVVSRIIRACSRTNGLVLDPFAGSASALVAALGESRPAVGIELNARYIEIAKRRLERAVTAKESGQLTLLNVQ